MPLTPEQRATRHAARRALARRVALRSTLGMLLLALLLALSGWWLLATLGGRDLLLRQVVARLPAGTQLTWQSAEGPLSGTLTLHGVRFSMPRQIDPDCVPTATASCAMGRITFTARTLVVDPAIRPLLGKRLRLDTLEVHDATLDLPRSDTPFELPRWPESLPEIAPPLALQAGAIRIDGFKVTREAQPLIDIRSARGGLDASTGRLHVERLLVDSDRGRFTVHGDYVPRQDYRTDLVATAVLPAASGRTPPRLGLVARGDLSRLDVALSGHAPAPIRAGVVLRGKDDPRWQAHASAEAFNPALFTREVDIADEAEPIAFDLRAHGTGGRAIVQGHVARGDFAAVLQPSTVRLEDQVLQLDPLRVDLLDGSLTVRGHADLRAADAGAQDPALRFAVNARGLAWGGGDGTPAISAAANFGIAGQPDAWAVAGTARLARGGQQATVRVQGHGTGDRITLRDLTASMPTGTLAATGTVHWSPQLHWQLDATLDGFDPGYFFPDWNGAVDGRLATRGTARANGGYDASLDVPGLGGHLRGRALDGHGQFEWHGDTLAGEVTLSLGTSRIDAQGRIGDTLDIDAHFAPLHLADLSPDAAGTLRGTLALNGPRNAPDLAVDLAGNHLRWNDWRAQSLRAQGQLPWTQRQGALTLRGDGLQLGLPIASLSINARGAMQALQLDAQASGPIGTLAVAGHVGKRGTTWSGALATLQLAPARGAQWHLQQQAHFRWDGRNGRLTDACLASSDGGTLCADADWPRRGLQLTGQGLPLALVTPYLPERNDDRPWLLRGEIALQAQLRPAGNRWQGTLHLTSARGGLQNRKGAGSDLITYDTLVLDVNFDPATIHATLATTLNQDGRIDARLRTGWDAYAPLDGEIALDTDALTWMELLSPDIVAPTGELSGRITLGGTRAHPVLGGQARLSGFSTEVPSLAIQLTQGSLQLDAQPDGSARIRGSVHSGEGLLAIDGTLGWRGDDVPLVLNVRGDNLLVSDTRDLRAVIDPDVVVRYTAGEPLSVTGTIEVPSAQIALENLDQGMSSSSDVVVLDPVDPERGIATPVVLDLTLVLGEDVRLDGFGLVDGTLDGRLHVRKRPGREMVATGTLDVGGRYTAYGQKLTITRGELTWTNDAIANPTLDIRAEREVGDVTAGIQVSGRSTAPQAEVWADPAMDEPEALAYLALGRPLSNASGDEVRQLDAASAALAAGGSLLASQLGAKIGLDDAGVMQSRTVGGVFGIGKYLSPRLYVSYGVSLLGTGQVLILKYMVRKGFFINIESSNVENRASLNWHKEK